MIRQVATVVCALVTFLGAMYGQNAGDAATGDFSANYASLKPEQKALVGDWIKRFSATIQKQVDPEKAYDNLPLSTKTTFSAVTHALLSTQLTDESGRKLGSAIQIIDKLDTVHGEVPGARGDDQFRIYVQLKPGALGILEKSQEFQRMQDNTVYHKGYPICYRSKPAVPSIQVSATQDETRADVDVDYKASGFPKGLVNGHLSAANSDVRAGRNDDIHNNRWQGLNPWWRSLLSLPLGGGGSSEVAETGKMPAEPAARAGMKPADTVFDMLNTWLVKKDAENVLSYFSRQSYACEELERGEKVDYGMAKFELLLAMRRANERFGNVGQLADISTAMPLETTGPRSKIVKQPYQGQFALYDVREDAAEQFKCANRLDASQVSPKAAASRAFGKYYGAVFRLGLKGAEQTTLATLWTREGKSWKLISYDVDPEWDEYRAPDTATAPPEGAPTVYAVAPVELVGASTKFLETWMVKRDVDEALGYLSAQCTDCVRANLSADQPPPRSEEDARAQLKKAMQNVIETTGTVTRLDQAIVAPQPNHADVKLVKHKNSRAFALASIPDYMASALDCQGRTAGAPVSFNAPAGEKSWGKSYAMALRLAKAGEDSGVLFAVWEQEGAAWKIVAFKVLTP
ncbi:MAG: hypothetical protein WBW33_35925 [Bryobacteraceae bacterium]